ncbi:MULTISPECIES: TetR/AcrR family transcriptional regulator [unclassified Rhodococcus (in: high G+C Gram-positive bacteria)]|uniref:TetR/AcrR family transcriptional regulator n=1 Tax=Rhodococcus navarretei TaxID=3128981 RepID=A0ABU9CTJ6_9NOCA|nr:TetR/AcrR family transcriptional regulator [Rhodococcus sp. ARC_M5]MCJ0891476.1 TetR/AcrR family transcriptional regulator [Rhodococcus sp. ARC_M5]
MNADEQEKWGSTHAQRRPQRTDVRDRLLAAAADEFTERGYAAAKLADIAHRAGFTKGAVYSNFESKQALFAELLARRSLDLAARVLAHVSDLDSRAAAGAGGGEIASWVVAEPRWPLLTVEFGILAGRDPAVAERYRTDRRALRGELERLIAERAGQWGVGENFDARRLATSLAALISGLAVEHSVDPEEIDEEVIADAVSELFAGAIARTHLD